jgi:hypothetical protein
MASKTVLKQRVIRQYKDETGKTEVIMREVAKYAVSKGWPLPTPKDPIDVLAEGFSKAARDEIRHDTKTGNPYRANHAIPVTQGKVQMHLWIDIDEASRKQMEMSLVMRRDQMLSDGLQLTHDQDHWNRINPNEEPIQLSLDFSEEIEWRKNAPKAS